MQRHKTTAEAIKEATEQLLEIDPSVIVMGEGIPDPKGVFGTTIGLQQRFGSNRVFDQPVSENGATGVLIGAAITGMKPIMIHQRLDFSLYAMDQIVNNAAKWHSMYGGGASVPLTIRAVIGRGWGQGNQHSQNLSGLYATIPGLKVVMPSSAFNAKGLLVEAVRDPNPVMYIEHRWIHNLTSHVPEEIYATPFKATVIQKGTDITLVSWSYTMTEVLKANQYLLKMGLKAEIIDLQSLRPLDFDTIEASVSHTGRLLVIEDSWAFNSLSGEIIAHLIDKGVSAKFKRLCLPDCYAPSTPALTKNYYVKASDIVEEAAGMVMHKKVGSHYHELLDYEANLQFDIPDASFTGPF